MQDKIINSTPPLLIKEQTMETKQASKTGEVPT